MIQQLGAWCMANGATNLLCLSLVLAGINVLARSRMLLFILNAFAAIGFAALIITTH